MLEVYSQGKILETNEDLKYKKYISTELRSSVIILPCSHFDCHIYNYFTLFATVYARVYSFL